MDVHDGDVDVVEEMGVELNCVAGGEEYHYFFVLLGLTLDES